MTQKHLTNQRFSDLPLAKPLLQGLKEAGFEYCTPIQAESLPHALTGKDVAGQAQTGTGKTIAFLLSCCHYLLENPSSTERKINQPRSIMLAPTRELAIQIHKDAEELIKHTGLTLGLVYGGTGYDAQKDMLASGVDILIGTPGRLIDFFNQKLFDLKEVQVVVLDEADRMFDLGFIKDIRYLFRRMPDPDKRLNLLYSATLSHRVAELAYEHMNDPVEVKIESESKVADKVEEVAYYPADDEKLPLLVNLIKRDDIGKTVVFVNTRHAAEKVSSTLNANAIETGALSGDVPQRKREKLLDSFKNSERMVLVATDVAARGLHIPEVKYVFNFDLPQDAEDYVHRIGRTARAGESGHAISFICEKYAYSVMEIEDYIGHGLPRQNIEAELLSDIQKAAYQPKKKLDKHPSRQKKPAKPHTTQSTSSNKTTSIEPDKKNVERSGSQTNESRKPHAESTHPESTHPESTQAESTKPTNTPIQEDIPSSNATASTNASSQVIKQGIKKKPLRFSRRFGEVPAIG